MAVRVTMEEVEAIIDIDSSITNIDAFITAANLIINSKLADTTYTNEDGDDTTSATKKEIERWLSAHLVAIRDMRSSREKAGPVAQDFQYKLGLNLQVTMYGQSCLMLDTTGTLLAMSNSKGGGTASVVALTPDLWD